VTGSLGLKLLHWRCKSWRSSSILTEEYLCMWRWSDSNQNTCGFQRIFCPSWVVSLRFVRDSF
jgi:hypothetical protein